MATVGVKGLTLTPVSVQLTDKDEINGDSSGTWQSKTVRTEQHQVANDTVVAHAFQQDGDQDGTRGEACPYSATERGGAALRGRRPRPGETNAALATGVECRRLEGGRRHGLVVVPFLVGGKRVVVAEHVTGVVQERSLLRGRGRHGNESTCRGSQ